jgi:hypothetical protein
MKQSTTHRHCEKRSDEAIQKIVDFRIASSLPLPAMTMRRVKACYYDITKNVIVNTHCVGGKQNCLMSS